MDDQTWDKVHQPCPLCDSSDAVGVNQDGSAKCFSCGAFMPNYEKACEGKDMAVETKHIETKQPDSVNEGNYIALTDKGSLKTTEQK